MANYNRTPIDALGDPTMTLDMPGMWRYWGPYMGRHIWRELNADGSGKNDCSMGEAEADLTLARLEELRKAYKPTYYGGEDPADESRDW